MQLFLVNYSSKEVRVLFSDQEAKTRISTHFNMLLHKYYPRRQIALVGIGTDRATGDSLGPLVGTRIEQLAPSLFPVYGTLDNPVHALNLQEKIREIHKNWENPLIIAVDASLGKSLEVGMITIGKGPLRPGSATRKNLPQVGEIFVTGVVNIGGFMEYLVLQSTRLSLVIKMAECIAQSLVNGFLVFHKQEKENNKLQKVTK